MDRPIRGHNPTSLNEARNEMRRLMGMLMRANHKYLEREQQVRAQHASGKQNYASLDGSMRNDLLLKDHSGSSKTCATLISGLSAYILAELAMKHNRAMLAAEQIEERT